MNASDELANRKKAKQKAKDNLHAYESRVTRLSNMPRRKRDISLFLTDICSKTEEQSDQKITNICVIVDLCPSFVRTKIESAPG